MAGDWIKFEHATLNKPEVFLIAESLNIEPDEVIGKLLRLWVWADQQIQTCNGVSVTETTLDRITGRYGFATELRKVGWIEGENGCLNLPNFERHNTSTAKNRALTNKRVKRIRNAPTVTESLPEKRREEKSIIPPNPQGGFEKKVSGLPTTDEAIRIAKLFNRRLSTPWSAKEVRAFKAIPKEAMAELDIVCKYTESERAKGDSGRHRRDLATFLNNFTGELDRAKANGIKPALVEKHIQFID